MLGSNCVLIAIVVEEIVGKINRSLFRRFYLVIINIDAESLGFVEESLIEFIDRKVGLRTEACVMSR